MDNIIYCVIGIEYNSIRVPSKIVLIGSFTNPEKAIKCRDIQSGYTLVDIVETSINDTKNMNLENEMGI